MFLKRMRVYKDSDTTLVRISYNGRKESMCICCKFLRKSSSLYSCLARICVGWIITNNYAYIQK